MQLIVLLGAIRLSRSTSDFGRMQPVGPKNARTSAIDPLPTVVNVSFAADSWSAFRADIAIEGRLTPQRPGFRRS